MKTAADIVEIIDKARETKDFLDLETLLYAFFRGGDASDRGEIVQEALLELVRKFNKGELSLRLQPQLSGILKTCTLRVRARAANRHKNVIFTDDDNLIDVVIDDGSDPAAILERNEALRERIAVLKGQKEKNPTRFGVLEARYQDVSTVEYIKENFGKDITPANAWKMREREAAAHAKAMQKIRKDASS
jgi:hypothetical protein